MSALGWTILSSTIAAAGGAPTERGMALGLFSAEASYDYAPAVAEIAELGATHLSVAYVWWQSDEQSADLRPVDTWTPTDAQTLRTIEKARALGLHVTVFPILRLVEQKPRQWRGTIAPHDEDAWWSSYRHMILHAAELARRGGAQRLAVGSELVSREAQRARWLDLIDRVRVHAPGLELMYSANWDHYRPVSFWDAVDVVGVTGYFELVRDSAASTAAMAAAWPPIIRQLERWSAQIGRPIVITEIGYPSLDGGAVWPWDQTRRAPIDLEEQRRAYAAFTTAWSGRSFLAGAYFWNWFGDGGPSSTDYTPRNKPAADVVRRWFGEPRFPASRASRTRSR